MMAERLSPALKAVSDAVLAVAAELSVDEVLQRLVDSARELAGARYAALGIPDGEGGFRRFLVSGMSDELIGAMGPLPRTHGMLGAMLEAAGPYQTQDIHLDPRFRASLELVAPYGSGTRLMLARLHAGEPVPAYLERHGAAIRYGYTRGPWPLEAYQNVYSTISGSAEMPSAGRPFSRRLITSLVARGVLIAPLTLHTGVSSPERHEPPVPEAFEVPDSTASLVAAVRGWGGRVIAVGTTVVRALETVAREGGVTVGGSGWTELVIDPDRELLALDGLITGWHEPEASHLMMLTALAGQELLDRSYSEALEHGYLWHEFGDSHLILP